MIQPTYVIFLTDTGVAKAICAIVLIIGCIITFVGHKCLGFEVVFLGAISGGIICYSVLTAIGYFGTSSNYKNKNSSHPEQTGS